MKIFRLNALAKTADFHKTRRKGGRLDKQY